MNYKQANNSVLLKFLNILLVALLFLFFLRAIVAISIAVSDLGVALLFSLVSLLSPMGMGMLAFHPVFKYLIHHHQHYKNKMGRQTYRLAWIAAYGPLFSGILMVLLVFIPSTALFYLDQNFILGTTPVTFALALPIFLRKHNYPVWIRKTAIVLLMLSLVPLLHYLFFQQQYIDLYTMTMG